MQAEELPQVEILRTNGGGKARLSGLGQSPVARLISHNPATHAHERRAHWTAARRSGPPRGALSRTECCGVESASCGVRSSDPIPPLRSQAREYSMRRPGRSPCQESKRKRTHDKVTRSEPGGAGTGLINSMAVVFCGYRRLKIAWGFQCAQCQAQSSKARSFITRLHFRLLTSSKLRPHMSHAD